MERRLFTGRQGVRNLEQGEDQREGCGENARVAALSCVSPATGWTVTGNGARRIAVCGKGGSGKTTVAGTLARVCARRGHRVTAIDGDSNPNLAITLGIPPEQAACITPLPRTLLEQRTDETGAARSVLAVPPEEIFQRYGVRAPDDVTLVLLGRVDHAGAG